jgi:hypothetical protein
MAFITVAGVNLPAPSDFQVSIMDLSNALRTADGTMQIRRIATKRKLELSWTYLSKTDLQTILSAVSTVKFSVTYTDPALNTTNTSYFYAGDRTSGMLDFKNGVPRYKDVKFSLIEY